MRSIALLVALASTTPLAAQQSTAELLDRARGIHERAITIDTHDDISGNFGSPAMNPCTSLPRQVDLPKMKEGGLDVAFFIVYVGQGERTAAGHAAALREALGRFEAIRGVPALCPDEFELARSPADVERIVGAGKRAIVIGIENGYPVGRDVSLVRRFHELGGRYLSLTHIGHNDLGDSSNPGEGDAFEEHGGLSDVGLEVVAEMNRVGLMIDVSHVGKKTMLQAIARSRAPVIASHSGARAVNDNLRNLDDEQLEAIRRSGGVAHAVAFAGYVRNDPPEKVAALGALREEIGLRRGVTPTAEQRERFNRGRAEIEARWPRATVSDFVDHIDYMVERIGIDHVGISSDFDGGGGVTGWNSAAETLNVTVELVRRGYTEEQIRKLWGENLLRAWREVERVAAELQREAGRR